MSSGIQFLDIIFFAMIAIFILLRLRSVLGRRTGQERRDGENFSRRSKPAEKGERTVINLPDRSRDEDERSKSRQHTRSKQPEGEPVDQTADAAAEPDGDPVEWPGDKSSVDLGLTQIAVADPDFDKRQFLQGATAAFEMIVEAFAKADTAALRPLLADDVYDQFVGVVRDRLASKQSLETTIVGLESSDMLEVELVGRTARITIKFISEQINVTRDADGQVVAGDESKVARVTDIWTFSRNTRSRDPNWLLAGSRSLT